MEVVLDRNGRLLYNSSLKKVDIHVNRTLMLFLNWSKVQMTRMHATDRPAIANIPSIAAQPMTLHLERRNPLDQDWLSC